MRKKEDSGKYILENNLRTWSELKRERMAALKEKEKAEKDKGTSASPSSNNLNGLSEKEKEKERKLEAGAVGPAQAKKKWGGCPNGCDHSTHYYKKENSMHAMQLNGKPTNGSSNASPIVTPPESLPFRRANTRRSQSSSDDDEEASASGHSHSIDVQRSLDEMVSSPDSTPSFISVEEMLRSRLKNPRKDHLLSVKHGGRDFGGSASGNTSQAGSDTEFSAEEDLRNRTSKGRKVGEGLTMTGMGGTDKSSHAGSGRREESQMGRGAMADALGDQSDASSEAEEELVEEIEREEREDKSVRGSVY